MSNRKREVCLLYLGYWWMSIRVWQNSHLTTYNIISILNQRASEDCVSLTGEYLGEVDPRPLRDQLERGDRLSQCKPEIRKANRNAHRTAFYTRSITHHKKKKKKLPSDYTLSLQYISKVEEKKKYPTIQPLIPLPQKNGNLPQESIVAEKNDFTLNFIKKRGKLRSIFHEIFLFW